MLMPQDYWIEQVRDKLDTSFAMPILDPAFRNLISGYKDVLDNDSIRFCLNKLSESIVVSLSVSDEWSVEMMFLL